MATTPTPTNDDLLLLHLQQMQCDAQACAEQAIVSSRRFQSVAQWTLAAACAVGLCALPLATWQVRSTDRVWRLRNPRTVRNHRVWIGVLTGLSVATVAVSVSPTFGFRAQQTKMIHRQAALDEFFVECLRLSWRLRQSRTAEATVPSAEVPVTGHRGGDCGSDSGACSGSSIGGTYEALVARFTELTSGFG